MAVYKGPGYLVSSSSVESELERLSPQYYQTYQEAMAQPAIAAQQQIEEQEYDFTKALTEAYKSSFQTMADVSASNLGQGYKERYLSEEADAFQSAYEAAQQGYQSNVGTIVGSALQQQSGIQQLYQESINKYAENIGKYTQSAYGYLEELYNTMPDLFAEGGQFERYTVPMEGDETARRLMSMNEITEQYGRQSVNPVTGKIEYEMTTYPIQELFQLLETQDFEGARFGDYLYEQDPELYRWLQSTGDIGTDMSNKEIAWKLILDNEYTGVYDKAKTFAGMTPEEVAKNANEFDSAITNFVDKIDSLQELTPEQATELVDIVKNFADSYGITAEELGMKNWNELASMTSDIQKVWKNSELISEATSSLEGPIGQLIGGLINSVTTMIEKPQKAKENIADLYNYFVDQITTMGKTKYEVSVGMTPENVLSSASNKLDSAKTVNERNEAIVDTIDDLYRLRSSMDESKFAQYKNILFKRMDTAIPSQEDVKTMQIFTPKSALRRPDKATSSVLSKILSLDKEAFGGGIIYNGKLYTMRDGEWYEETSVSSEASLMKKYLS